MPIKYYTVEEHKRYREENQVGFYTAKDDLTRKAVLEAVNELDCSDDLKEILHLLVERTRFS